MSALREAHVREALRLDALPRVLRAQCGPRRDLVQRIRDLAIVFAFSWLGPLSLPLWAYIGLHPIALAALACFFVVIPCLYRASTRRQREDALRLYGPPEPSIAIARVLRHAPWLFACALSCAAVPLCWMLAREQALSVAAWGMSAIYFLVPLVIYSHTERLGSRQESVWGFAIFVILFVAILAGARYASGATAEPWNLGWGGSGFVGLAIAASMLAIVRNIARGLRGASLERIEGEDVTAKTSARRPVEFAAPSVHRPARSAFEADRLLARLQREYEWRSNPVFGGRAFTILVAALRLCVPAGIAILCIQIDSYLRAKHGVRTGSAVSLGVLWLAAVTLAVSGELSGSKWLLGHDWRDQFVAERREWLQACLLPVLLGTVLGVALHAWNASALAAGALVLAGCLLREGAPWIFDVVGEGGATVLGLLVLGMGPVLYFFSQAFVSVPVAWTSAASAVAVGALCIAMRWRASSDERLGMKFREANQEDFELLK